MKKKYNIALTPTSKGSEFIDMAKHFAPLHDQYCLGTHSLPHVTLIQFYADENLVTHLWENACQTIKPHQLTLRFSAFSVTSSNNTLFWVALMPDQRETLYGMHLAAAEVVGEMPRDNYDPHLTLINTKDPTCQVRTTLLEKKYQVISDEFVLSIGDCDAHGQVTGLITSC